MNMKMTLATLTLTGLAGVATAQTPPAKAPAPATKTAPAPAAGKTAPTTPAPAKTAPTPAPTKADPKAAVKADPKAAVEPAAKPVMPKPPTEVADMAKQMGASWRCTGTNTSMEGTATKMTATVRSKVDMDKWWINSTVAAKGTSGAFKMVSYTTFDPTSKKWRRVSVDNWGGQYVGTSDGVKDNKLTWNLDVMGSMGAGQFRDNVDMTDKKAVKMSGEMSMDKGKTWKPVYELTCKK